MPTDSRFSETESLSTYLETVAASVEAVLPRLITRYGINDRSVVLTREAVAKIREVTLHLGHETSVERFRAQSARRD
jgi:hypothetical protein